MIERETSLLLRCSALLPTGSAKYLSATEKKRNCRNSENKKKDIMELMPFKNLLGLPPVSMVNSLANEYTKGREKCSKAIRCSYLK